MKKSVVAALLLAVLMLTGCAAQNPADQTANTTGQDASLAFPGLGGVMPELTVTTADGQNLKLSDVLEEKKLVVLNYWFADCTWCLKEFPVMELAYQRYKEDVEIIALSPVDSAEAVADFQQAHSLSFPMAACPRSWAVESGIRGYPTSVFIDRDGVVCLIHAGAITDAQVFYDAFEAFTSEDYERKLYRNITDLEP